MTAVLTAAQAPARGSHRPVLIYEGLLGLMAVGFGILALRPLSDPDVWWHLRTGELVFHQGFADADPWSQMSTRPWILHEWATELLMYLAYHVLGYRGVVALHAIAAFALALLVLRSIRRETSATSSVVLGAICLVGLFLGSAERPQLVSWCLLAAAIPRLHRAFLQGKPPWWFVPLIAVWANLHGLWVVALVLFWAMVLGYTWDADAGRRNTVIPFFRLGLASTLAAALNPAGLSILLTPLHVRGYADIVTEWAPPSLLDPYFAPPFLLVALLAVCWSQNATRVDKITISLALAACLVGLAYNRTTPVAVIVLAPLVAAAWQRTMNSMTRSNAVATSWTWGAGIGFVAVTCILLPLLPPIPREAPWAASRQLDALPGRASVLNEYDLGGWLLWTARDTAPGVDGRTEIYSPSYVGAYVRALGMSGSWERFVKVHRFQAAWLRTSTPLVYGLKREGWQVTYRNDFSVILVPPRGGR
jgi:hypothetical protein